MNGVISLFSVLPFFFEFLAGSVKKGVCFKMESILSRITAPVDEHQEGDRFWTYLESSQFVVGFYLEEA